MQYHNSLWAIDKMLLTKLIGNQNTRWVQRRWSKFVNLTICWSMRSMMAFSSANCFDFLLVCLLIKCLISFGIWWVSKMVSHIKQGIFSGSLLGHCPVAAKNKKYWLSNRARNVTILEINIISKLNCTLLKRRTKLKLQGMFTGQNFIMALLGPPYFIIFAIGASCSSANGITIMVLL